MGPYILMFYATTEMAIHLETMKTLYSFFMWAGGDIKDHKYPMNDTMQLCPICLGGPITTDRKHLDNVIAIYLAMFEIIYHRCLCVPTIGDNGCCI